MDVELRASAIDAALVLELGEQVVGNEGPGLSAAGRVGVWTKADSVTAFDDLRITPLDAP